MNRALFLKALAIALLLWSNPFYALASHFDGGGIDEGVEEASNFNVGNNDDPRTTIENLLFAVLSYMALAAVIAIIAAGIILVVAGVSEQWRERARKIVLYCIVGLIIILLSSGIVAIIAYL